jgi:hypothetical protein
MEGDSGRFIDLATRPLEPGSSDRDQAATELFARIAHAEPRLGDDTLAQATDRLQSSPPASRWTLPVVTGIGVVLLSIVIALILPQYISEFRVLGSFHRFYPGDFGKQQEFTAKRGEALWLHEPPLIRTPWKHPSELAQQAEAKFAANPSDPVFYQQYACVHLMIEKTLPAGYRETWQRIDPDNALWPLVECASLLKDAGDHRSRKWTIADPAAMDRAVAAFKEAAAMRHFRDHEVALEYRQSAAFPPPSTLAEAQIRDYFVRIPLEAPNLLYLAAKFDELARTGDRAGFDALAEDWKKVVRLMFEDLETDDSGASTAVFEIKFMTQHLGRHYLGFGDRDAAAEFGRLAEAGGAIRYYGWLEKDPALESSVPHSSAYYGFPGARSFLRDLTNDPFKARRLAEYSLADRFASLAGSILAILALLITAISAFRRGSLLGGLSRGLTPLFRPADHAWIIVLGFLLPVAFWVAVVPFSPLGCRDMALVNSRVERPFLPWLLQVAALYVLVSVSLFQTARWRWSKRGALLSLRPGWLAAGWIMVLLAAAAAPASGAVRYWPAESMKILQAVSPLAGIPLLWLCWHAMAMLFAPRSSALRATLTARSLLPAKLAFAAFLLAGAFLLQSRERHWMAEDVKNEIDVTLPDASRFKGEVGKEIQRRVMDILDH